MRDYPGFDIERFNDYTVNKCAKECDNHQGCSGYIFIFTNDICYIKHTTKASGKYFKPNGRIDLFIRNAGPSGMKLC